MSHFDGRLTIRYEGRDLGYREIEERPKRVTPKRVIRLKPPVFTPPPDHPWRVYRNRFPLASPPRT